MRPGEEFIAEDGNVYIVSSTGQPVYVRPATEEELINAGLLDPNALGGYNSRGIMPRGGNILGGGRTNSRSLLGGVNSRSLLTGGRGVIGRPIPQDNFSGINTMGTGKLRKSVIDNNTQSVTQQKDNCDSVITTTSNLKPGYRSIEPTKVEPLHDDLMEHRQLFTDDDMLLNHYTYTIVDRRGGKDNMRNSLHSMCINRLIPQDITNKLNELYQKYNEGVDPADIDYTVPLDKLIANSTLGSIEDKKFIEDLYTKLVMNAPVDPNKQVMSFAKVREAVETDANSKFSYIIDVFDKTITKNNKIPLTRNRLLPMFTRVLYIIEESIVCKELYQSDISINTPLPKLSAVYKTLEYYSLINSEIFLVTPLAIFRVHSNGTKIDTIKYITSI